VNQDATRLEIDVMELDIDDVFDEDEKVNIKERFESLASFLFISSFTSIQ